MFSFLINDLGLKLDVDSAKNLLIGLRVATQSFSINVSPETFEAGAICLKATQQSVEPVQSTNLNGSITQDIQPSTDSIPTA
jgi:nanoRNase/pAp phosphatase (c-di-AMP/oligoRNAs hydrolase)